MKFGMEVIYKIFVD